MSKTTIRNFIIATILLAVAMGLFSYMLHASGTQQQELANKLESIDKRTAQEAAYLQARKVAQDSKEDRELLAGMFLDKESDSIDFLNDVESLASDFGVTLETNSLQVNEDKKTKTKTLLVDVSFAGSREQVHTFIELLEQLQYIAEITRFSSTAQSSNSWEAEVTIVINLQDYAE